MKRDHLGRPEIRWVIDSECDNHEIRYGGDELFSYLHAIPADAPLPEGCEEVCIVPGRTDPETGHMAKAEPSALEIMKQAEMPEKGKGGQCW